MGNGIYLKLFKLSKIEHIIKERHRYSSNGSMGTLSKENCIKNCSSKNNTKTAFENTYLLVFILKITKPNDYF